MANHEHINVSWSQLRTWEDCKQKAYLYRKGMRSAASDIRMFFPGTVVDRIMRDWLYQNPPESGYMVSQVAKMMDTEEQNSLESGSGIVRWKNQADRANVAKVCTELLTRLEPILQQLVLPHDYEPAKRFKVPLDIPGPFNEKISITMNGEMDLLVREQGTDWCVYDLKATANDSYWRKTVMQLVFYDLAVRASMGKYSTKLALIQPLCKEPIVMIEPTEQLRSELVGRIINYVHSRAKEDYAPKEDTSGCSYCDVRFACLAFRPVNGRVSLTA